jgi:DNA-binding MarR family transcriptional regulator
MRQHFITLKILARRPMIGADSMDDRDEKFELARLVARTQGILFRLRMRKTIPDEKHCDQLALTPQQCHMVMCVHEQGSMTVRQLTQALYVNAPAVSIMVERLVELGVLTREENPKDRREVIVRLSPDHCSRIEEIEQKYLQTVLDLFEKIGIDSARMWGSVCQRIQNVFEDMH